jgi:hypothetical protein
MDKKTIIIKCKICEKILDLDNPKIGTVLKDNSYYCIPCHEVIDFCDFLNEDKLIVQKKNKPIVKKEEPKATTLFKCYKCKVEYSGKNCTNCNEVNILFIRKKKKKK